MLKVTDIARLGLMVAVMEVSKLALAALPNIELVSFWIILFTLSMGYRTLYAVYAFVLLEGILYGVHFWWVAYLYVWTLLLLLTRLFHAQQSSTVLEYSLRRFRIMLRRTLQRFLIVLLEYSTAVCRMVYWRDFPGGLPAFLMICCTAPAISP